MLGNIECRGRTSGTPVAWLQGSGNSKKEARRRFVFAISSLHIHSGDAVLCNVDYPLLKLTSCSRKPTLPTLGSVVSIMRHYYYDFR